MADTIDGTIAVMRAMNPNDIGDPGIENGQIFRSRETSEPKRESIFVWDPTTYVGPLYESGEPNADDEVPRYVGFPPDIDTMRNGSRGVWRWVDPPKGEIDATRVYGISPDSSAEKQTPSTNAQLLSFEPPSQQTLPSHAQHIRPQGRPPSIMRVLTHLWEDRHRRPAPPPYPTR